MAGASGLPEVYSKTQQQRTMSNNLKKIKIESVDINFEREPLSKPFGFKGGFVTELWQAASFLHRHQG